MLSCKLKHNSAVHTNMSWYEMGYDAGFGVEKVLEIGITRNVGAFGVNTVKFGLGGAMFKSSTFGGNSIFFGRGRLGSFGGSANGIFNSGKYRVGWSWHNYKRRHEFIFHYGPKNQPGVYHSRPFFYHKP